MQATTQAGASAHGSWFDRFIGKAILACAGGALLLGAAQARAAVVTDQVFSQSSQSQAGVPVTFGQVFKAGDVPSGQTVVATLNGQTVPLQVDPKATNPDGSLRHAVLTVIAPSLPGGSALPLALSAGSPAASMTQGAAVGLSQLLATNYDATVSVNLGGTNYSLNARGLLQAADLSGACAPWGRQCNLWLSGPLVSTWVVNGPLTSAAGTTYPNLSIYFVVRAYAGTTPGTVGYVRTDIIVENSNAFAPQAQPQYTATLTSGSASYTSPALTQYTATRWHKVLWWNNAEPKVYLQQDTQYIQNSMAVSRYMPLTPDESFLVGLRQSCAPLDYCDQSQAMGTTGAQAAIGPLPRWTSVYIVYPDVRAYNWMLANTDALGAYSIHYRDPATGWPVSIQKHPYITIAGWSYANSAAKQSGTTGAQYLTDLLPNCINNSVVTSCSPSWYGTGNPNVWDNAHQPAESYVPYMVTGDYYYMSELAFGASQNELWSNNGYRGLSQGLIDQSHSQVRGKAWTLREMADAAWLLPDSYPLKAEFNADVENALADWNAKYTNNPNANPLHFNDDAVMADLNGGTRNGLSPWQHNFLVWSVNHASELGFAGATPFRNWLAKFEIGLMTDWQSSPTQGYCWLEASAYQIQVKDASGNWLSSFSAVYQANFPTLAGLTCNSPAMVAAMGKLEGQSWQVGQMHGYASSATGFPSNLQIGLAAIADSGLPNAAAAWSTFDSRSVKPSGSDAYNNYPNFAVLPRSAPQTSEPVLPLNNSVPARPWLSPDRPRLPPSDGQGSTPPSNAAPPVKQDSSTSNPVIPSKVSQPMTGTPPTRAPRVNSTAAWPAVNGIGVLRSLRMDIEPAYYAAIRTMHHFAQMVLPRSPSAGSQAGNIPSRANAHAIPSTAVVTPVVRPQPRPAGRQESAALPHDPINRAVLPLNDICNIAWGNQAMSSKCARRQ